MKVAVVLENEDEALVGPLEAVEPLDVDEVEVRYSKLGSLSWPLWQGDALYQLLAQNFPDRDPVVGASYGYEL